MFFDIQRLKHRIDDNKEALLLVKNSNFLLNKETFKKAFTQIFENFNNFNEIETQIIVKILRKSIYDHVYATDDISESLQWMLDVVMRSPKKGTYAYTSPLDTFFSCVIDNPVTINEFADNFKHNKINFKSSSSDDLPISFLIFLTKTKAFYEFSTHQIRKYFSDSPELLMSYFISLGNNMKRITSNLVSNADNYLETKIVLLQTVILSYITCIASRHKDTANDIFNSCASKFDLITDDITESDLITSFFLFLLMFCRVNEHFATKLFGSSQISFREIFHSIISGFGPEKSMDLFYWLINPSMLYPFANLIGKYVFDSYSENSPMSFTFVNNLMPLFLKELLDVDCEYIIKESFFIKLNIFCDSGFFQKLITSTLDETDLLEIFKKYKGNKVVINFLIRILSIKCSYRLFVKIYELVSDSLEQTIELFHTLSEKSLIVNDFMQLYDKVNIHIALKKKISQKSIFMWVLPPSNADKFLKISFGTSKVCVNFFMNNLKVKFEPECYNVSIKNSIDGWCFIEIQISENRLSFSCNFESIEIHRNFNGPINISLGNKNSCCDIQSIRVFDSILSHEDRVFLFSCGPNYRTTQIQNFSSLKVKNDSILFYHFPDYVSGLYSQYISGDLCINKDSNFIRDKLDFLIEPPYNAVYPRSKSKYFNIKEMKSRKHWHYTSFINSVDAVGGTYLIAHLLAESIIKFCDPNSLIFLHTLTDRFPVFHNQFVNGNFYQAIGQILRHEASKMTTLDKVFFDDIQNIYKNSHFLRHIIFNSLANTKLFYNVVVGFSSLIKDNSGNVNIENKLMLQRSDTYKQIINALAINHVTLPYDISKNFMEAFIDLEMSLTEESNARQNIYYVFSTIIIYFLQFSQEEPSLSTYIDISTNTNFKNNFKASEYSCTILLGLLNKLLNNYGNINPPVELLLGAFYTSEPVIQIEILNLCFSFLDKEIYQVFLGLCLYNHQSNKDLTNLLFGAINVMFETENYNILQVTSTVLYFLSNNITKYSESICKYSILFITNIKITYPILEHCKLMLLSEVSKNIDLVKLSSDGYVHSLSIDPHLQFIKLILCNVFESKDFLLLRSFFISLFCGDEVCLYPLAITVFVLITSLLGEDIEGKRQKGGDYVNLDFSTFLLNYVYYILYNLYLIPGKRDEVYEEAITEMILGFDNYISLFFKRDKELNDKFEDILSLLPLVCINYHDGTIEKMNPELVIKIEKSYSNFVVITNTIEEDIRAQKNPSMNFKEETSLMLQSLICDAINYKVLHLSDILSYNSFDIHFFTWKTVFEKLMFPDSFIYRHCPVKCRIHDNSLDLSVRRILFPINPSLDSVYFDNWEYKYRGTRPKVRLLLDDILRYSPMLQSETEYIFTSNAVYVTGISDKSGIIAVSENQIRFYGKLNTSSPHINIIPIDIEAIRSIRRSKYLHQSTGITIEDCDQNLYIFSFGTQKIRDCFIDSLHIDDKVVNNDLDELKYYTQKWVDGSLSTFHYIFMLNIFSGRNWTDHTQIPIFPWIMTDFDSIQSDTIRNFKYPIYAQNQLQKESCRAKYEESDQSYLIPYHQSEYISNIGSNYYLFRLEPFTTEHYAIHKKMDNPDRMFFRFRTNSMHSELVPEVFFMPEILKNFNNLIIEKTSNDLDISDVELPSWAKNNPRKFVSVIRKILEGDTVSSKIHEWFDLVWGLPRNGNLAIERYNVFPPHVYHFDINMYKNDKYEYEAEIKKIKDWGYAPPQLFFDWHPRRNPQTGLKYHLNVVIKQKVKGNDIINKIRSDFEHGYLRLRCNSRVKKIMNGFEYISSSNKSLLCEFDLDISVTHIDVSGNDMITCHAIPIVNFWTCDENSYKHYVTLRGCGKLITTVSMSVECRIICLGHDDGSFSLFSIRPCMYLRNVCLRKKYPISSIVINKSNSEIIIVQKLQTKSLFSIYTVNGDYVKDREIDHIITDIQITCFALGTCKNICLCTTNKGKLIWITSSSLKDVGIFDFELTNREYSLFKYNDNCFYVYRSDGKLTRVDIIREAATSKYNVNRKQKTESI